jgi:hypothetical protein
MASLGAGIGETLAPIRRLTSRLVEGMPTLTAGGGTASVFTHAAASAGTASRPFLGVTPKPILFLLGPSGVGKTHLAGWVADDLRPRARCGSLGVQ